MHQGIVLQGRDKQRRVVRFNNVPPKSCVGSLAIQAADCIEFWQLSGFDLLAHGSR